MSNIAPLQDKLITLLQGKMDSLAGDVVPRQVKAYEGELAGLKSVRVLPSVMVDVAQSFDLEAKDVGGTIFDSDLQPELILFAQNKTSGADTVTDLAKLADWTINAIKSEVIFLDGPLELSRRIRGRMITDIEPASCILTLELRSPE